VKNFLIYLLLAVQLIATAALAYFVFAMSLKITEIPAKVDLLMAVDPAPINLECPKCPDCPDCPSCQKCPDCPDNVKEFNDVKRLLKSALSKLNNSGGYYYYSGCR
jgi:hypothetical protein